ncbi:autophagy-related protein 36-like [Syzygium oleosum]|uniref:autophagy-related protein 36-like n=1 Tax=Syzygium oleosum TaxID=219896 RepID=UPI0024BA2ADE|nr:autophagy-related protein 36-like [Syzygium oleosum]
MASSATPTAPSSKRSKKAPGDDDERPPPTEEVSDGVCCGICLTDGGRAVRGRIDSCDHHFCFVCIMKWAKVESTCPMCKRRFSTIRRPPKDGAFADERILNIPPRNQVDDLHRIGSFNPYREAQCAVCRGTQDKGYLLICELCDLAFHTYCVGLGITIPQDWSCPECAFMRDEHSRIDEGESCIGHVSMQSPISLFDIPRDRRACNYWGCTIRLNIPNFRGSTTRLNIVRDSGASNVGRPE